MKRNRGVLSLVVLAIVTTFFVLAVQPGVSLATTHKAKAKTHMLTGKVEKEGAHYVIKSGKTTRILMGKEDFAKMAGKEVKAWGMLEKTKEGHVLKVAKIEEVAVKSKKK